MSWQLLLLDATLRLREKPFLARETDFVRGRARLTVEAAKFPLPPGTVLRDGPLGAVPAGRLDGPSGGPSGGPVCLWFHGGAYCVGSPRTHALMVAHLAARTGAAAVLPDYRLAPEHPFPAALDDAIAAWEALCGEGIAPTRIVLGGDSAGGGLAFALLHHLCSTGAALPAGVIGFSPWADLTGTAPSLQSLAWRDALIPARRFDEIRKLYLGGADPADPRASPVFGTFAGAPPVLLQSSRAEVLRDDARRLAARLRDAGVDVTHDERSYLPHVWQMYPGFLPEADAALDRAAAWARARLPA